MYSGNGAPVPKMAGDDPCVCPVIERTQVDSTVVDIVVTDTVKPVAAYSEFLRKINRDSVIVSPGWDLAVEGCVKHRHLGSIRKPPGGKLDPPDIGRVVQGC